MVSNASEHVKRRPLIGLTTYAERAQVLAWDTEFAAVAFRGQCPDGPGYWYPSIVLAPVDKQSGLGRELGPDAVDAFAETKNVFIATEL